jgi:hypothetical protein
MTITTPYKLFLNKGEAYLNTRLSIISLPLDIIDEF